MAITASMQVSWVEITSLNVLFNICPGGCDSIKPAPLDRSPVRSRTTINHQSRLLVKLNLHFAALTWRTLPRGEDAEDKRSRFGDPSKVCLKVLADSAVWAAGRISPNDHHSSSAVPLCTAGSICVPAHHRLYPGHMGSNHVLWMVRHDHYNHD